MNPVGFETKPSVSISLIYVRRHPKPAHIGVCHIDTRIVLQFFYARQSPASCAPWVLMDEMPAFLELVAVQYAAEFQVQRGFFKPCLVFALPFRIVLVLVLVQFLKHAKQRAWWRSDYAVGLLLFDLVPGLLAVLLYREVPSGRKVE